MKKALVVEDDVHIVALISALLARHNFEIVSTNNGHDALSVLASAAAFDLIILDIFLPKLSGIKVAQFLREQDSKIPLLIVSAHLSTTKIDLEEIKDIPQLAKPFGTLQFDEAIQKVT